jgi:beta-lactamase class A
VRLDKVTAMNGFLRQNSSNSSRAHVAVISVLIAALILSACSKGKSPLDTAVVIPTPTIPLIVTPLMTPMPTATPEVATPEPVAGIPQSDEQRLSQLLLEGEAGVYGFVVLAEDGTVLASHNAEAPFITASLYKLILMADIYRRIEAGELSLDQHVALNDQDFLAGGGDMYFAWDEADETFPIRDLLFAAGAYSSNVAARTLLGFTNPASLRETAEVIGMERTYLLATLEDLSYWPPQPTVDSSPEEMAMARQYVELCASEGPFNVTTPLDMARYQLGLVNGTLISPWVSNQILEILEDQLIRDRIPFFLPEGIRVANKPGNLEDVVNDTGVIFLPEGPRAMASLSEAVPDDSRATLILQRLALIASGADEYPPVPDSIDAPASDWVRSDTSTETAAEDQGP